MILPDLDERDYHAHPALSSTGARKLLPPSTPARFHHERQHPKPPTESMILGKAAHRLALGTGARVEVADYPDFRTTEARQWRDGVLADDAVPLLANSEKWQRVQGMKAALEGDPIYRRLFDPERGTPEASLFWDEAGVPCRARLDFLPHQTGRRRLVIPDYKTTAKSAHPVVFARTAAEYGYPQQDDFYRRGVRALLDSDPAFVFVVQETEPPYLVSFVQVRPDDQRLAADMNDIALRVYAECAAADQWPGYGTQVHQLDMPTWWRIQSESLIEGALA